MSCNWCQKKIKGAFTVYDFLYKKDSLIGRKFIPNEGSRHQVISGFSKDKNPKNTKRNYNNETITLYEYYKNYFEIEINDLEQPLIEVENKNPQYKENIKYYVPELCTLIGIDEEDSQNMKFMEKIIEKTRLEPDQKIKEIKRCIDLFYDLTEKKKNNEKEEQKTEDKKTEEKKESKGVKRNIIKENLNTIINDKNNSSNKKREYYGIEIEKKNKPIRPYYIIQPTFANKKRDNLSIKDISRVMPVADDKMNTDNWICLYSSVAEEQSFCLLNGFKKCAQGYGLKFKNNNSNWIPMKSNNAKDWINRVEKELNNRKDCQFVIFLLSKSDLYIELKKHSIYTKGYISQVINLDNFDKALWGKRGPDSYISKVLLQINSKLGGFNYYLEMDSFIYARKLMLIGVDSSHIWGKLGDQRTGISMVSTQDENFMKFLTKEEILRPDEHYASETRRVIHAFIEDAYNNYIEINKKKPKNIIIYRQGIAHNQLKFVELEAKLIEQKCQKLHINYYYVLVNTTTNVKFFEYNYVKDKRNNGNFKNPEPGLVILDQITNKRRFEFFIQPQKVNIGSATPTYFHVAYGNMNFPELLIQLTYWTTYLYSNWQNAVRVPHVIKMAEKLAYMTAKYTHSEINGNLLNKQSFL